MRMRAEGRVSAHPYAFHRHISHFDRTYRARLRLLHLVRVILDVRELDRELQVRPRERVVGVDEPCPSSSSIAAITAALPLLSATVHSGCSPPFPGWSSCCRSRSTAGWFVGTLNSSAGSYSPPSR